MIWKTEGLEYTWTSSEPQSWLKHCSRQSKLSRANASRPFAICYWICGTLRSGGCLQSSVTFCGLRPQQFCDMALWPSGPVEPMLVSMSSASWLWLSELCGRGFFLITSRTNASLNIFPGLMRCCCSTEDDFWRSGGPARVSLRTELMG